MNAEELRKELSDPRGPNPARLAEILFTRDEIVLISQRAEFIARCLVSSGPIRRLYENLADITDHLEACLARSVPPPQPTVTKMKLADELGVKDEVIVKLGTLEELTQQHIEEMSRESKKP
jgi:hypothetical protein